MPLLNLIGLLVVVGVLLWALNAYASPYIHPPMLRIINAVAIVAVVVFVLSLFFDFGWLSRIRIGR